MNVIRNFPNTYDLDEIRTNDKQLIGKLPGETLIIYQGSINVDRGLEEMIDAMPLLPKCRLIICGDGDVLQSLKKQVSKIECSDRIEFKGKISFEELAYYTIQADLGLSIEKQNGLSYSFALPNKFFDYIQAGIPSVISSLPEMQKINAKYNVAVEVSSVTPQALAESVTKFIEDASQMVVLKENTLKARNELNWTKESKIVEQLFTPFLNLVR